MSKEEIRQAQGFESEDARRAAGLRFVREVVEDRGHPSDEALDGAREAGYSDEGSLEMVAHVGLTTFSNYTNDLVGTELDYRRPSACAVKGAFGGGKTAPSTTSRVSRVSAGARPRCA